MNSYARAGVYAAIGGEGSTTGSLTLADTAVISGVDGLTAAALKTTDGTTGLDLTGVSAGGITVNIDFGGPGAFTVLDYAGTATGFTAGSGDTLFAIGSSPTASGRGAIGFADTGTAITLDLGFASRTWDNDNGGGVNSGTGLWIDANTTDDNWVEGDQDFFNGDSVTFDDTPGAAQTITLGTDVAPGFISFANDATTAYTIDTRCWHHDHDRPLVELLQQRQQHDQCGHRRNRFTLQRR